jgi:hypothetical protein
MVGDAGGDSALEDLPDGLKLRCPGLEAVGVDARLAEDVHGGVDDVELRETAGTLLRSWLKDASTFAAYP